MPGACPGQGGGGRRPSAPASGLRASSRSPRVPARLQGTSQLSWSACHCPCFFSYNYVSEGQLQIYILLGLVTDPEPVRKAALSKAH